MKIRDMRSNDNDISSVQKVFLSVFFSIQAVIAKEHIALHIVS